MGTHATVLAEAAHRAAEAHRLGIDLTDENNPVITDDWHYRLSDDQLDVRRDRLTGELVTVRRGRHEDWL